MFARGTLPCDLLLVGEGPGDGEDVVGLPFIGPAGDLLDSIVARALNGVNHDHHLLQEMGRGPVTVAFYNMVGCMPKDEQGYKVGEPDADQLEACLPRLLEFIDLAQPSVILCVGKVARDWLRQGYKDSPALPPCVHTVVDMLHPAAILKGSIAQREMSIQRCVHDVRRAAELVLKPPAPEEPAGEEDILF